MFQRNYKPQKGLVFVFVYFNNQCSARRLQRFYKAKRLKESSIFNAPLGACDAFTKRSD